ncbi:hypothetical protein O1L44_22685 [Streptomyces noursei]|nr:hypothetical protein [Streptomyces noursei]
MPVQLLTHSPASFAPPPGAPAPGPGGQPPQGGYGFPAGTRPRRPAPGPGLQGGQGGYGFHRRRPRRRSSSRPAARGACPRRLPGPARSAARHARPGPAGQPGPPPPPQQGADDWTLTPPNQPHAAHAARRWRPAARPGPQALFEQPAPHEQQPPAPYEQQQPAPFPPQQQPQPGPDGQWGGAPARLRWRRHRARRR